MKTTAFTAALLLACSPVAFGQSSAGRGGAAAPRAQGGISTSGIGAPSTAAIGRPSTSAIGRPSTSAIGRPSSRSISSPSTAGIPSPSARGTGVATARGTTGGGLTAPGGPRFIDRRIRGVDVNPVPPPATFRPGVSGASYNPLFEERLLLSSGPLIPLPPPVPAIAPPAGYVAPVAAQTTVVQPVYVPGPAASTTVAQTAVAQTAPAAPVPEMAIPEPESRSEDEEKELLEEPLSAPVYYERTIEK